MERERILGQPLWLALVILGAAGVAGYLLFFRKSSSSADQGATGYSSQGLAVMQNPDESATMALQNQELSFLRNELEGGLSGLGQQIGEGFTGTTNQFNQLQTIGFDNQALMTQYAQMLQQGQTNLGAQLGSLQNSVNGSASANTAYYNSLLTNLINYANSLSSQVQSGDQQAADQLKAVQGSINQLGAFQGWQFYQLPDRYTPTIPTALNPPGWS